MKLLLNIFLSISTVLVMTGCGGTTGGNPVVVTVSSSPYTNDGTVAQVKSPIEKLIERLIPMQQAVAGPVSSFMFCITKMKVVASSGGSTSVSREAVLGLIDVSSSTVSHNWGGIQAQDNESISELHLELHRDPENCSAVDYSLSYNGTNLTKDLEFKFKFDPAITVQHGDTLELNLSVIAKAIEDAAAAGQLSNEQIGNYLQTNTIGTGEKL